MIISVVVFNHCYTCTVMPFKMIYELNFYIHVVLDHRFCTRVGQTHYDLSVMKY